MAVDGGETFNVPAGTRMEITNKAFGSQPQRLYAKTITQVVGGNSRFISIVSPEDITTAQNQLKNKVIESINDDLAAKNVKLIDGSYTINVTSFITDKPEGTETQNFSAELKINVLGLAYDDGALRNIIRQRFQLTLGSDKSLQPIEKDTVKYNIKNLDIANGVMQLGLHYESLAQTNVDAVDLQSKIAGKSRQEASDLILSKLLSA